METLGDLLMRKFARNSKMAIVIFLIALTTTLISLYLFLSPKEIRIAFYIDQSSDTNPDSAYRQSLVIAMDYFNEKADGLRGYRFVPVFLSSVGRDKILKEVVASNAKALILAANPAVTQLLLAEAPKLHIPVINIEYKSLRIKNPWLFHVRAPDTEKNLGQWAREVGLGDYIEITPLRDPLFPDDLESWFADGMGKPPRRRVVYADKNSVFLIIDRLSKEEGLDGVYVNLSPYDGAVMIQAISRAFPKLKIFARGSIVNPHTAQVIGKASQFVRTITPQPFIENQGFDAQSKHPFIDYLNRNEYTQVMNENSMLVGYNAIALLYEAFRGQKTGQELQTALASQEHLFSLSGTLHKNEDGDWVGGYYRVYHGTY